MRYYQKKVTHYVGFRSRREGGGHGRKKVSGTLIIQITMNWPELNFFPCTPNGHDQLDQITLNCPGEENS